MKVNAAAETRVPEKGPSLTVSNGVIGYDKLILTVEQRVFVDTFLEPALPKFRQHINVIVCRCGIRLKIEQLV